MSTEPFKFSRDVGRVQWWTTLQVNLLRSLAAGCVFGIVMFVGSIVDRHTGIRWSALAVPLAWPLVYLVILLPVGIVAAILAGLFDNIVGTIAALIAFMMSLYLTAGDPLVYFLQRAKPAWIPIERYPFFGFTLILWVLKPVQSA